jgi:hypothetical protein
MSYVLPGEIPYVMLKSVKEEFIFTDCALLVIKGGTVGTKKSVTRLEYCNYNFSEVGLKTPGVSVTDLDGEIAFRINGRELITIDIRKDEWEAAKPLYYALVRLQRAQHHNTLAFAMQKEMLAKMMTLNSLKDDNEIASVKRLAFGQRNDKAFASTKSQ